MQRLLEPVYALSLIAVLFASGCEVNPVTGKNELSLISSTQEIALGEKSYGPSR